jgi:hypothetical protein
MRKTLGFVAASAVGLMIAGASYAGHLNGPVPKSAPPPVGGGSHDGVALYAAAFLGDGTIIVGIGSTTNAVHISTGVYQVDFLKNINSGCVWLGSPGIGAFSGTVAPSMISVTGRAGTTKSLFVQTFNSTGSAADIAFEIHVICG